MTPIRKILVPTDFSVRSQAALQLAGDLARRYGASVTLLHVYHVTGFAIPDGYVAPGPKAVAKTVEAVERGLAADRLEAEKLDLGRVDTASAQGVPADEIVKFAGDGHFDLVVMASHGRTGLGHALLGSVAEHVVRNARCPVLTIKTRARA